jgi:hypothetical protein
MSSLSLGCWIAVECPHNVTKFEPPGPFPLMPVIAELLNSRFVFRETYEYATRKTLNNIYGNNMTFEQQ